MKLRCLRITLLALLVSGSVDAQQQTCDANAEWSAMIAAKGGRQNLADIHATLVTQRDPRSKRVVSEKLSLANFVWGMLDNGDPRLGSTVAHIDLARGYALEWISDVGPRGVVRKRPLPEAPAPYFEDPALFLETGWMKPTALSCRVNAGNSIVQATYFGVQYEFYLAKDQFLPFQVVVHMPGGDEILSLRDYTRHPSGIMLASDYTRAYKSLPVIHQTLSYEINPRYKLGIRELSPAETRGRDGWKAGKQGTR